jgi:hypothetical protein
MEDQKDVIESYKLEITTLEKQRELYLIQINAMIAHKKNLIHGILNPKLLNI